jgi:hypothetical protein
MLLARPLALGFALLGLLALPALPYAAADNPPIVVHDLGELPTDGSFGPTYQSCTTPGQVVSGSPGTLEVRTGPAPVPLGVRTWGYDVATPDSAVGPFRAIDSMGVLAADQMSAYAEGSDATGVAVAEVIEDGNTTRWYGRSDTLLTLTAGSWTTVSGLDASYQWLEVTVADGQPTGNIFTGTIPQMLTHNGTGDQPGSVGLLFGCNTSGLVHFDNAQFGGTGDVATYDFEGPATRTTIHGSRKTIAAGGSVTITGITTARDGTPLPRAKLTLQRKRFGGDGWKKVGKATATDDGTQVPARLRVEPVVGTRYRWVYPLTGAADGSISKVLVVRVHSAVTARAVDRTVPLGGRIIVFGTVKPLKPGRTVALYRGSKKLARTKIGPHGAYSVSVKATSRGLWKLHVAIGAASGDLAGTSPTVKVRVG